MGQLEVILRTGPIKVSIVDADSDFPVLLFHWHDVRYPFRVIAHLQESRIHLLDDLLFNAKKKISSLTQFKTRPDLEGVWFFCSAYVDLFGWLDRGELVIFKTMQTLLYFGYATVLVKSFPKVYG
ncbi:hypothetical protein CRG98_019911 [Punica granatum]|uniref:Uncharacterized protein n=1 Tax=Punica granatum TaxID=22663 RepID=A0A2I0JTV8_PUNGR|nr:hypothetical protein CRG98_019911 [Punica granatum]